MKRIKVYGDVGIADMSPSGPYENFSRDIVNLLTWRVIVDRSCKTGYMAIRGEFESIVIIEGSDLLHSDKRPVICLSAVLLKARIRWDMPYPINQFEGSIIEGSGLYIFFGRNFHISLRTALFHSRIGPFFNLP